VARKPNRHKPSPPLIDHFLLPTGRVLGRKYEVLGQLGRGWEGEVYLVRELATDIERAAKFFFPHRNPRDQVSSRYAQKLFKLRHCPILIQYHTQEHIVYRGVPVTFLVSDFVEGQPLSEFLKSQPGKRLTPFQGLHLLHTLAVGIEPIHNLREYHGDIHDENIVIQRFGIGFDLKLLDMFHWGRPRPENLHDDVCDMIRIFYDAIGGQRHYAKHPPEVKAICCGLKRSLILRKYKTAGQLRQYLETMQWQ
jgi:serine/threonine protein kinase